MLRRVLVAACLAAATSASVLAGPAAAEGTCVDTTDRPFDGTVLCAETNSATNGYRLVPYSVGSVCAGGVCTEPQSGTLRVPLVNLNVVRVYGTLCYTVKVRVCRPVDTAVLWPGIG